MTFIHKNWINEVEGKTTPISAEALVDLENRLATYTDNSSSIFINPKEVTYGAVGDGTTDDTTALQNAINASVSAKLPLFLPPGTYKITSGLSTTSADFSMFGAGGNVSLIAPNSAAFDALTIGPGAGGSGNIPRTYYRDFGFTGGGATAEITKKGVAKTTGNAAFKLNGQRLAEMTNIVIVNANFDIGFDLVNNSFGAIFNNCRADFSTCRVGMNVRETNESGNDINWNGCWFSGEVACVQIAGGSGGFHFRGGQYNVNRQGSEDEDLKGAIIIGKDYTSGVASGDVVNVSFDGIDFEECNYSWFVRGFGQHSLSMRDCAFLANGAHPVIGVYKNSAYKNSRTVFENNRVKGTFSANSSALVTFEEAFGGRSWVELTTSGGGVTTGSGEVNLDDSPLALLAKLDFAHATYPEGTLIARELLLRHASDKLQISADWGINWTTASPGSETVASANTIAIGRGIPFVAITGTTEIKKVTATLAGHVVTLKFAGILTVTDGENLKLASSFTTTANDTITLACDGTNWYEIARSVN